MSKALQLLTLVFLLSANLVFAQNIVNGLIIDKAGRPLVAATVVIKGTNQYAEADTSGKFSLEARAKLPFTLRNG